MECEEVRKYIYAFLDDELDVERNLDVLEHLNFCAECSQRFEEERSLGHLIRHNLLRNSTPSGLRQRVHENIIRPPRQEKRPNRFFPAFLFIGLTGAGIAGLAFTATAIRQWVMVSPESSLMTASAERHAKYLRDELPMEIVSDDPTAVSDYFRTKFAFPLNVASLAAERFQLVGGRLCHLVGCPAACVVYHRSGSAEAPTCTLCLFMVPDTPSLSLGEGARTDDNLLAGRAVERPVVIWRQEGVVAALVSDSVEEEIIRLARVLQTVPSEHAKAPLDGSAAGMARR